jgi:type IV pilus assembly protein PilA
MKSVQKGFTLIELMIVVAIIGILAAIAIPAYQDYTIRSQVTEGLNLASSLKASVSEYFASNGTWPTALGPAGTAGTLNMANPPSGKYVSSITLTNGTMLITYSSAAGYQANTAINGSTFSIKPLVSPNNDVIWVCGYHAAPTNSAEAPGGASGAVANTILQKYLPNNCRT